MNLRNIENMELLVTWRDAGHIMAKLYSQALQEAEIISTMLQE